MIQLLRFDEEDSETYTNTAMFGDTVFVHRNIIAENIFTYSSKSFDNRYQRLALSDNGCSLAVLGTKQLETFDIEWKYEFDI